MSKSGNLFIYTWCDKADQIYLDDKKSFEKIFWNRLVEIFEVILQKEYAIKKKVLYNLEGLFFYYITNFLYYDRREIHLKTEVVENNDLIRRKFITLNCSSNEAIRGDFFDKLKNNILVLKKAKKSWGILRLSEDIVENYNFEGYTEFNKYFPNGLDGKSLKDLEKIKDERLRKPETKNSEKREKPSQEGKNKNYIDYYFTVLEKIKKPPTPEDLKTGKRGFSETTWKNLFSDINFLGYIIHECETKINRIRKNPTRKDLLIYALNNLKERRIKCNKKTTRENTTFQKELMETLISSGEIDDEQLKKLKKPDILQ